MAFGIIIGILFGGVTQVFFEDFAKAWYNRQGLDDYTKQNLQDLTFDDVSADELLVTSYEFNSHSPRFYSKYFKSIDPGRYDVYLRDAVAASSSAPIYFDPKRRTNQFSMNETLIDGGLICNTPSLYAYQMAKHLLDKPNIRLLSLGTGENTEIDKKMSDKENFSKLDSIMSIANQDFVTTFEMIAADKMMQEILPDAGRYLRMNVETKAALDDKDVEKMQRDGNQMYMNN